MKKPTPVSALTFDKALERYRNYLSVEDFLRLQQSSDQPASTAIRVNLLKSSNPQSDLKHWAELYGWQVQFLPFHEDSFQVLSYQVSPSQTVEHRLGYYYIQDAASILPVSLFDSQKNGKLTLDMAASPGGKTTQLVDLTHDQGFVLANDSSASRLTTLRTVLQTWGTINTAITNFPGEKLGAWFPETFDRVLLDAPCSMESLRQSASHPFREITQDERERLSLRQFSLLLSAVSAAKVGAEIVYSTCSLAPEEDEMVLDRLLKMYPGVVEVDQSAAKKYGTIALSGFGGIKFSPEVKGALRVWPYSFGTNGFFAVKLIKQAPLPINSIRMPVRDFSATGLTRCADNEADFVKSAILELYGFDLAAICQTLALELYKRDNSFFLLPAAYLSSFSTLPFYSFGMQLGRQFGQNLEVTSAFISRFAGQFIRGIKCLSSEESNIWLKGLDLRNPLFVGIASGTIVAVRDEEGRNLGAGKVIPGRLRNLLPNYALKTW